MTDAAFWDRIAPRYAKSPISNVDAYEATLARVRTYLGPQSKVLELGCGTGMTALKLYQNTASYTATDISPGMIQIAQDRLDGMDGPLPAFQVGGLSAEELASRNANTVLAFNLLHLVPNLEAALAHIHAALPKDGLFISKTPAIGEKWYLRPLIGAMRLIGKAPFVRSFKIDELDQMLEAAGFRIDETALFGSMPSRFVVARKV
ncbi:MAG: class I SAM-dependent methyltransferase [Pseudomonadota bacterium]